MVVEACRIEPEAILERALKAVLAVLAAVLENMFALYR
jgi:hypothetical protein